MGNSEVGHMNIGAGRIIYQDLTRITKDIEDGTFFKNEELLEAMENCRRMIRIFTFSDFIRWWCSQSFKPCIWTFRDGKAAGSV